MALIGAAVAAFVLSLVGTPLAGRLAHRLGILDRPGPLKVHSAPIPYLGGLAVFVATALVGGIGRPMLVVPLSMALLLGVLDDRREIPPVLRLAGELVIAATAAALAPTDLPGPFGPLATGVAVVLLINAVNLIDGLDGLAGGVGLVSALGFAALLGDGDRILALALAGALAGFLVHNRPPARIYLGDGGAYFLGTALALLLAGAWSDARPAASAGALALVAVPVGETAVAVIRRWRAHQPLFEGDRGHVYDQMVERGWSAPRTALTCVGAQAGLVVAGVAAGQLEVAAAAAIVAGCAVALLVLIGVNGFLAPGYRRSFP